MLKDVEQVRQQLLQRQGNMLARPAMWGCSDSIEALFIERLELLHFIDYPACRDRCSFRFFISCSMWKTNRNFSITGAYRQNLPEKNDRELLALLIADLQEIWLAYLNLPHPYTAEQALPPLLPLTRSPWSIAEDAKAREP